jgi:hypothetical protein
MTAFNPQNKTLDVILFEIFWRTAERESTKVPKPQEIRDVVNKLVETMRELGLTITSASLSK